MENKNRWDVCKEAANKHQRDTTTKWESRRFRQRRGPRHDLKDGADSIGARYRSRNGHEAVASLDGAQFDRVALTRAEYEREVKAEEFRRSMGWAPRIKGFRFPKETT